MENSMVTEDYVSFETAKLLKEKGFDNEVKSFYAYDSEFKTWEFEEDDRWDTPNNWGEYYLSAPTIQMAMKWLRKVHNLHIVIDRHYFVVDRLSHIASGFKYSIKVKRINTEYTADFNSYEQACEVAIKYCLENLI